MQDGRAHQLLAQIPLTVSPYIQLPAATTLPYTYKSLPSTLPQSSTGEGNGSKKPKYVMSTSGHAAHPDDILESCQKLQRHLNKLQEDAERTLKEWDEGIRDRELAEKRRIAPGWLDRDERILEPARAESSSTAQGKSSSSTSKANESTSNQAVQTSQDTKEGEEIDRVFGGLVIK